MHHWSIKLEHERDSLTCFQSLLHLHLLFVPRVLWFSEYHAVCCTFWGCSPVKCKALPRNQLSRYWVSPPLYQIVYWNIRVYKCLLRVSVLGSSHFWHAIIIMMQAGPKSMWMPKYLLVRQPGLHHTWSRFLFESIQTCYASPQVKSSLQFLQWCSW